MKFQESKLAHFYCKGEGIEIGGAAHNPFNIPNCKQVAPKLTPERRKYWEDSEINTCGEKINVDIWGDAEHIPLFNKSQDYVITSHVIEHVPNPINAFKEWDRILKKDGIVFMIFPKRDADPIDKDKPISTLQSFIDQYNNPQPLTDEHCHIWIFTLQSMLEIIEWCNKEKIVNWEILETQETDDKVFNGHTIVAKKIK
jgi:SAM-dependent methyltransferase